MNQARSTKHQEHPRGFTIVLLAAISLDGFITKHGRPGSGFTSPEDKRWFREAVQRFDCLILGSGNYRESGEWIERRLRDDQLKIVLTREPARFAKEEKPGELEFTSETPKEIVAKLRRRGRRAVCVLGGSVAYGLFLDAGAVDEVWLTVEPLIFGEGTKLAAGRLDARLELLSVEKLNQSTLLLKYRVA